MPRLTREALLDRVEAELAKIPVDEPLEPRLAQRRARLETLMSHLRSSVMSPSVLEAIAMRIRQVS